MMVSPTPNGSMGKTVPPSARPAGLKRRVYLALLGFLTFAGVGVGLAVSGHIERDQALSAFVEAWRAEQEIEHLEQCLRERTQMVALLQETYPEGQRQGVSAEIREESAKKKRECAEHISHIEQTSIGPGVSERVLKPASELLASLQFVLDNLGVNHADAIVRQAQSDVVAEELLNRALPEERVKQVKRIEELQSELSDLGVKADYMLVVALVIPIAVFGIVTALLLRRVVTGLRAISLGTDRFGAGDFSYRVELGGNDEFVALSAEVNAMAHRIERSQLELAARALELERSLATLEGAQRTLVEQQKLAALGELVAGLAHEVNTPIGVAVTSGSLIAEHVATLREHAEAGTATRGLLKRVLAELDDAMRPLLDNLGRAAQLIRSFRQVAVDRGDVTTRHAVLSEWSDGVAHSLLPMCKKARVTLVNRIDLPHTFELAAGELEQVLTNLIVNAATHAYDAATPETDPATRPITLSGRLEGRDFLILEVEDQGVGMPQEVAARVFEPFFTTRRGRGGSGLGMHIVHQLIQGRFSGTISLNTAPGRGARWTLKLPLATDALRFVEAEVQGVAA
jgi:signal transduction histidine kinase